MGSLRSGSPISQNSLITRNIGNSLGTSDSRTDEKETRTSVNNPVLDLPIGTPRTIEGLVLWLDANDTRTIIKDAQNKVSHWIDKSGSGFAPLIQDEEANKPSWITNRQNGKAGINFARARSTFLMAESAAFTIKPVTMFAVLKPTTVAAMTVIFVGDRTQSNVWAIMGHLTSGRQVITGLNNASSAVSTRAYNSGEAYIQTSIYNDLRRALYNGGNEGSQTGAQTMGPYNRTALGRRMNTSPANAFDGDIYEILIYTRDLSATQLNIIHQYLSDKWSVSIG